MTAQPAESVLTVVIGGAFFAAVAALLLIGLPYVDGWRSLSQRYRATRPMPGNSFVLSGTFRTFFEYRGLLRAGSDTSGLYLSFWPRIGHPPLYLPWSDVVVHPAPGTFLLRQVLMLGKEEPVKFATRAGNVRRLLENAGQFLPPQNE